MQQDLIPERDWKRKTFFIVVVLGVAIYYLWSHKKPPQDAAPVTPTTFAVVELAPGESSGWIKVPEGTRSTSFLTSDPDPKEKDLLYDVRSGTGKTLREPLSAATPQNEMRPDEVREIKLFNHHPFKETVTLLARR